MVCNSTSFKNLDKHTKEYPAPVIDNNTSSYFSDFNLSFCK